MDFKYFAKEILWMTGLYSIARRYYRKLQPTIAKSRQAEIEFYKNLISGNDLIFDVGAHLGDKADVFLACGAKVIAIEPDKRFINHIRKRFSNESQVHFVDKGISSKSEKLIFYRRKTASTSGVLEDWWKEKTDVAKVYEIETTTLDLLIEQFGIPNYIKIDVEGFEFEVLRGLSKQVPLISFEFHKNQIVRAKKCINFLTQSGYSFYNVTPTDESFFVFDEWLPRQNFEEFLEKEWNIKTLGVRGDIYVKYTN